MRTPGYVLLALVLVVEALVIWPVPHLLGDQFAFWYAGHLVATGRSPYDQAEWAAAAERYGEVVEGVAVQTTRNAVLQGHTVWAYPPWTAYLFLPFGILPAQVGLPALHLAVIAAALGATLALALAPQWRSPTLPALAVLLVVAGQPFVFATRVGQFVPFLLLGVALVAAAVRRRRVWPLVAGSLVLASKPHLVWVLGLAILALLVARRAWTTLAVTGTTLAVVVVAAAARHPESLASMSAASAESLARLDRFSTTWSLAQLAGGDGWVLLGIGGAVAATALAALAIGRAPRDHRLEMIVAASLALSLAVTPYAYSLDHLLLAPAFVLAVRAADVAPRSLRAPQLVAAFLVAALAPWLAYFVGWSAPQAWGGAIPFLALLVLAASGLPLRRGAQVAA